MNENQEMQLHTGTPDDLEISEQQQKAINKMAARHYKKNKKEIDRLTAHSRECLISCNADGYKYAITKLRVLCQQKPLDSETLHSLWLTSKTQTDKIIIEAMKIQDEEQSSFLVARTEGKTVPVCSM